MRYPKPDAPKLAWIIRDNAEGLALSCIPIGMIGGFVSVTLTIFNFWFLLLFLPVLTYVLFVPVWYRMNAVSLGSSLGDETVKLALKSYRRIDNPITKGYALPLLENIYAHAEDHEWVRVCSTCRPRLNLIEKLVPNSISSNEDIERAANFVKLLEA